MKIGVIVSNQENVYGQDFIKSMYLSSSQQIITINRNEKLIHQDIDLIISHDLNLDFEILEKIGRDIPKVIHLHYTLDYFKTLDNNITEILKKVKYGNYYAIVPTLSIKDDYQEYFKEIKRVFNGVDINRYHYVDSKYRNEAYRQLDLKLKHKKKVFFIGRIEDYNKGYDRLIKLIDVLQNEVHFIIQHLPLKTKTQELDLIINRDDVTYHNDTNVNSDRIIKYNDILVSLSRTEVAPMVVIEALASGLKVIATRSTSFYDELVNQGLSSDYLRIVEQDQSEINIVNQIKNEILQMTFTEKEKIEISQWTKNNFNKEIMINKFNAFYAHVLLDIN